MIFNSFEYAIFLPLVFLLYWRIGRQHIRSQNLFLLVVSYIFYGWWDYRFLSLIAFSSLVDFLLSIKIERASSAWKKKALLCLSLAVNLGLLGVLKYYNFFVENFIAAFSLVGDAWQYNSLQIILPVGISFYTFQTISYSVDVYRGIVKPIKDPITFFSYVSFFPQLVAGPIERATTLLPQFTQARTFDPGLARDGLRQILWGLFKKVVIADSIAVAVNLIFKDYHEYNSLTLVLGIIYFPMQVYCDFSGYSDIAIGSAKLFGFRLIRNFAYPYFSRDIAEFWRRWHISLSVWFRDYVYIPLGGSRGSLFKTIRNVMIVFMLCGLWHGADWNFIFWGALNGLYFIPLLITNKHRRFMDIPALGRWYPTLKESGQILFTFSLTALSMMFFRAESLYDGFAYLYHIIKLKPGFVPPHVLKYVPFILVLIIWEWWSRDKEHGLRIERFYPTFRRIIYFCLVWMILYYFVPEQEFFYFQF